MEQTNIKQIGFWALIILGVVAIVAGMIWLISYQATPKPTQALTIENTISADDWVRGNRQSKVTLIEYSDFQCPACAMYEPIIQQLSKEFGDNLALVYRHFPLPQHQHAKPMAYASEAAGLQNKFWEMHDMIFAKQSEWTNEKDATETIQKYAKDLGLDVAKFTADFQSKSLREKTDTKFAETSRVGLSHTPTFFLNGVEVQNIRSYADFQTLVAQAINDNK
jgi:protein-disulfide isomerase